MQLDAGPTAPLIDGAEPGRQQATNDRRGGERAFDVVVVGAGLAGLTAGAVAARRGARVLVVEGRTPGGRAAVTTVDPGVVFNRGPRALYRAGAGWRVLSSLGIEPQGRLAPTDGHGSRGGEVHRLPGTAGLLLRSRLLGAASKVRAGALLATVQRLDASRYDDRSVEQWLTDRRLDPDAQQLIRSVIRVGTYVDDIRTFSGGAAIRQLKLALGEGVMYLDGGWQQLVDALVRQLDAHGAELLRTCVVQGIEPVDPAGGAGDRHAAGWIVQTADERIRAASVVVATGGPDAVDALLPVPLDRSGLGDPATAACLELAVRRPPATRFLLGIDEPLYLSVHTPFARLGPDGIDIVHVMRYGARSSDEDRGDLWAHAARVGIAPADVVAQRFLHRMVVTGGIPIAAAGGVAGRPAVQVAGADGLFIAGDWVGDEGLIGDAAMASGERAGTAAAAAAAAADLGRDVRTPASRPLTAPVLR